MDAKKFLETKTTRKRGEIAIAMGAAYVLGVVLYAAVWFVGLLIFGFVVLGITFAFWLMYRAPEREEKDAKERRDYSKI